jgi:hypothetical protein
MRKLLVFLSLIFFLFTTLRAQQPAPHAKSKTYKKLSGPPEFGYYVFMSPDQTYGYDILDNRGNVVIHQPNMPAIQGNRGFARKADAVKVAALVINKMQHNIMLPTISIQELNSLQIQNN